MNTQEIVVYLERLRKKRKITQEEYLYGIVSPRQYQRYRRGNSIASVEVLSRLSTRLGLDYKRVINEFELEKVKERMMVQELYNGVIHAEFDKAMLTINSLKDYQFLDVDNQSIFLIASLLYDLEQKKISNEYFSDRICSYAYYPEILDIDIISEIELLSLTLIYLKSPVRKDKIIERFSKIFVDPNLVMSGNNIYTYMQILFYMAKYYGEQKDYSSVILYCGKAIKVLKENYSSYQIEYFYYFSALAHFYLGNTKEHQKALYYSIMGTKSLDSPEYTKKMYSKYQRHFNVDPEDFFSKYN